MSVGGLILTPNTVANEREMRATGDFIDVTRGETTSKDCGQ